MELCEYQCQSTEVESFMIKEGNVFSCFKVIYSHDLWGGVNMVTLPLPVEGPIHSVRTVC